MATASDAARESVLLAALALDEDDREQVAMMLLESLDHGFAMFAAREWQDELARRVAAVDSAADELLPWKGARDFLSSSS